MKNGNYNATFFVVSICFPFQRLIKERLQSLVSLLPKLLEMSSFCFAHFSIRHPHVLLTSSSRPPQFPPFLPFLFPLTSFFLLPSLLLLLLPFLSSSSSYFLVPSAFLIFPLPPPSCPLLLLPFESPALRPIFFFLLVLLKLSPRPSDVH